MATKKPLSKGTAHFHIPADPLRLKAEEIKDRHSKRGVASLKSKEVTLEMLYELLGDILDQQAILATRLDSFVKEKR
ncbi:hypothetical protein ACFQ3W_12515 [Paenibacillus puldeungensis]|uniref:Uncharacterized protein n=1 Tax=Paenibacillus puldeungensis TaxID=696536 RepID=A0ABW3RZF4_9BACL